MMTRTAGGPVFSPLDFNERRPKSRFTPTTWMAIGVVALAHLGVAAAVIVPRVRKVDTQQEPARAYWSAFAPASV